MRRCYLVLVIMLLALVAYGLPITPNQAQMVAQKAAESVWGSLNLLDCTTLQLPDGSTSAYGVIFGRNDVQSINYDLIQIGYQMRQAGNVTQGWQTARAPESYVYAIVSADDNYGPIMEMCDGLPSYLIFTEDVKDMGEAALGTSVEIGNLYYLFPLDNWFEVTNGQQSVIVNPRMLETVTTEAFANFEKFYDYPTNQVAASYWEALLSGDPLPTPDNSGNIPGVPNFNQTDTDCGPHSAAQAVGYWDNHTYMGQGPWGLLIDTDFWGLRDEMRTAMGWQPGGGVTVTEIHDGILTVCNSPAYNNNYTFDAVQYDSPSYGNCTQAIDGGRPGDIACFNHPTYGNHAMTLVGYNDTPSQMVQVHDNWPPNTDEPMLNWGGWFDGFIDVFPAGSATTPITLQSFVGQWVNNTVELTWTTACEIDCYGYDILRTDAQESSQINSTLIPSKGNSAGTTTYSFKDDNISAGKTYTYTLRTKFTDGRSEISATTNVKTLTHELAQNMPNPFNPTTNISYQLSAHSFVNLSVYDISGKKVAELVNGMQEAGSYRVNFNASDLASGIYFYQLQTDGFSSIRKMALVK